MAIHAAPSVRPSRDFSRYPPLFVVSWLPDSLTLCCGSAALGLCGSTALMKVKPPSLFTAPAVIAVFSFAGIGVAVAQSKATPAADALSQRIFTAAGLPRDETFFPIGVW